MNIPNGKFQGVVVVIPIYVRVWVVTMTTLLFSSAITTLLGAAAALLGALIVVLMRLRFEGNASTQHSLLLLSPLPPKPLR